MSTQNATGKSVALRGALYAALAVLSPVAVVYADAAKTWEWPALPVVVSAVLSGMVSALVAVRAFLDGSNERYEQGAGK